MLPTRRRQERRGQPHQPDPTPPTGTSRRWQNRGGTPANWLRTVGRFAETRRTARTLDPAFTMATYQHVLPGMQAQAAATFATLLSHTEQ